MNKAELGVLGGLSVALLLLSPAAQACPFCGHGSGGDTALSVFLVVGLAFLVVQALRKKGKR